jgi:pimeloyl-ACP methyl ester carboxylesterase
MAAALASGTVPSIPYTSATTTYHTAQVDGVKIFYREAGPKDAPTIVLLHGYPSTSRMWNRLIPLLADRYHLIAPDYPGFGHSDAPTPDLYRYTFDHLAETTAALLKQLGLTRYTLFMQDYGGPVGFRIAMAAPEKVEAIIVQNANAYQEGLGAKWANIAKYWTDPNAHPEQVDAFVGFAGTKARHLGTSPNPERYDPDEWDDEFTMLSRPGQRAIQGALLYDYQTNIASYPRWQAWLREHKPKLLVMWGRYDPSFIVPGAEGYKRDVPDAEMHILDAGHFALDEKAEEIARLTRDFMGRAHAR